MKSKQLTNKLSAFFLTAVMALSMTGCMFEDENNLTGDPDNGDFMLTLTVITGTTDNTRAAHEDDLEEEGSVAENYIDFSHNDIRIIIYDNAGNFLFEFTPNGSEWKEVTGSGAYAGYMWEGKMGFPDSWTREDILRLKDDGFQAMAVANWHSFDSNSSYDGLYNTPTSPKTLSQIWNDNTNFNFRYPVNGTATWRPEHTTSSNSLIPMFGVTQASPFYKRPNGRYYAAATIPMQRAVAKVEIIDNLAAQNIAITNATMTRYNTNGRFITDVTRNPNWDRIGSQVDVSSLPDVVSSASGLRFFREQIDITHSRWVAYVPEMLLETPVVDAEGNFGGDRTHVDITISDNPTTGFTGGDYQIHFAQYDALTFKPTIPDDSWNHILRNHIYRFYVNKVNFGAPMDIHLHVIPWNVDDEEVWDFTDNVTVTKNLTWVDGTYESMDDEGNVFLHLKDDEYLEGHFRIISPINGNWYAYLTPLDGSKSDAIIFVDRFGEPLANPLVASGQIVGNDQDMVLRIMPSNFDNDSESRYRLEIYVENLGKWYKVSLVENDDFDDYIIVRRSNIIIQ